MKLVKRQIDRDGRGTIVVCPTEPEDLWHAFHLVSVGDRVRLAGLVAKPELNGREGTVVSIGDRIGVKLDGAEKALAIQPQNLEIEVVTERGVRLRTHEGLDGAIGSLIYLCDAAPAACENCGAALPPVG